MWSTDSRQRRGRAEGKGSKIVACGVPFEALNSGSPFARTVWYSGRFWTGFWVCQPRSFENMFFTQAAYWAAPKLVARLRFATRFIISTLVEYDGGDEAVLSADAN
jgi:hypothetical protein